MANRRRASGSTRLRAHFPNEMERPTIPLPPIPSEEEEKSTKDVFKGNDPPYSPTPTNQTPPMPEVQPNELDAGTTERVAIVSPVSVSTGGEAMKEHKDMPTNPAVLEARKASFASSTESAIGSILHSLTDDPIFSMNPDDYKIGPAIGFGSSAIVYHTTYLPLNMPVAVKMMDLDHFERNQIDELRKEIQVMTLCKHSNLLKIYASFVHDSKLWIVTPYLSGGSCLDIMKTGFRDGLEESVIATILQQALLGLKYLHRNGHIHRDVKAGNLLMDSDGTVQLADFGVSSSLMEDIERKGIRKTFVGTPCWMAPEVMEMSRGYDVKADIWSFGITALELAYGHAPFAKYPPMKVIYLTLSSAPPTLERKRCRNKYSKTFKEMIDQCLQRDPSKRFDQVLLNVYIKL